jgi:hypothetical protein
MSQPPQPLPISHLYAIADHRAVPEPFELTHYQPNTQGPQVGHAGSLPSDQDSHRGSLSQVPTQPTQPAAAHTFPVHGALASYQTQGIPNTSIIFPARPLPPTSWSYVAELKRRNVGTNCVWTDDFLSELAELEPTVLHGGGEKRRAFWKAWVDLRHPGLELDLRDTNRLRLMITQSLRGYPWFNGDQTMQEAVVELIRMDTLRREANRSKAQAACALLYDKVAELLAADDRRMAQALAQAQAQAQAQEKSQPQGQRKAQR